MGRHVESLTFFLFARPAFWAGVAGLMDFGNTLFEYNVSSTPEQADAFATKADWLTVGDELRRAVKELEAAKEVKFLLR